MAEDLERRLDAVERAITGDDRAVADLTDAAEIADRVDHVEDRTDDLAERLADLEAAVRALRGFVGQQRATADGPAVDGRPPRDRSPTTDGPDARADTASERRETDAGTRDGTNTSERGIDPEEGADGETRRLDVDTGDGGPSTAGGDGTSSDGPAGSDGATEDWHAQGRQTGSGDGGRLDPKRGETTADGAGPSGETVAWDWNWATGGDRDDADGSATDVGTTPGTAVASSAGEGRPGTVSDDRGRRGRREWTDEEEDRRGEWPVESSERTVSDVGRPEATVTGSSGGRLEEDGGRESWEPSSAERWPEPDDRAVDDRRPGAGDDWPEGLDVDRAQPWSVPDPPRVSPEEHEEEDGLLERLREAL